MVDILKYWERRICLGISSFSSLFRIKGLYVEGLPFRWEKMHQLYYYSHSSCQSKYWFLLVWDKAILALFFKVTFFFLESENEMCPGVGYVLLITETAFQMETCKFANGNCFLERTTGIRVDQIQDS